MSKMRSLFDLNHKPRRVVPSTKKQELACLCVLQILGFSIKIIIKAVLHTLGLDSLMMALLCLLLGGVASYFLTIIIFGESFHVAQSGWIRKEDSPEVYDAYAFVDFLVYVFCLFYAA